MKKINLREIYPDVYTTDFFVEVTEDVIETIQEFERAEAAYRRKIYRYKAQYSLDCENGIENAAATPHGQHKASSVSCKTRNTVVTYYCKRPLLRMC